MIKLVLVVLIIIIIILIINTNRTRARISNTNRARISDTNRARISDTNRARTNDRTRTRTRNIDNFNITNAGIPERIVANQRNDVYDMSCSDDMAHINNNLDEIIEDAINKRDEDAINKRDEDTINKRSSKKVRFMKDKTIKAIDKILHTNNTKPYEQLTLNKNFVSTQFNDAYRDVMTAINVLCPDLKIIFNLQTLPVTTTLYDTNKRLPKVVIDLITDFITKLNDTLIKLPETSDIINDYNNYLPLTAQLSEYTKDKGINKFYKDIGIDYNLYADIPKNSIVQLVSITQAKRDYTEAETRYIISIIVKKIIKSVSDQMKLTINFVIKNDTMEGDGTVPIPPKRGKKVAIEFVFIDGYYTNDYDVDYECISGSKGNQRKEVNNDGDDEYYPFNELGTSHLTSDHDIITAFNKKQREHELQMNNFSENVPYPVTAP
jgi:hypothetical protein